MGESSCSQAWSKGSVTSTRIYTTKLQLLSWSRIESNLDHIIFVSRTTLDNTLKKFGRLSKPVEVVYNGVDLGRFKPKKIDHRDDEEDREPSITQVLFVGRLAYSKGGVFELIEAVKRLNSKRLALTIVVSTTP